MIAGGALIVMAGVDSYVGPRLHASPGMSRTISGSVSPHRNCDGLATARYDARTRTVTARPARIGARSSVSSALCLIECRCAQQDPRANCSPWYRVGGFPTTVPRRRVCFTAVRETAAPREPCTASAMGTGSSAPCIASSATATRSMPEPSATSDGNTRWGAVGLSRVLHHRVSARRMNAARQPQKSLPPIGRNGMM